MFDLDIILGRKTTKSRKPIIDRVSKKQRSLLNRTKGVNMKRFADNDRDFVPNGLDCAPNNKRKHSLWPASTFEQGKSLQSSGNLFKKESSVHTYLKTRYQEPGPSFKEKEARRKHFEEQHQDE